MSSVHSKIYYGKINCTSRVAVLQNYKDSTGIMEIHPHHKNEHSNIIVLVYTWNTLTLRLLMSYIYIYIYIYRVSQEECEILRESVP